MGTEQLKPIHAKPSLYAYCFEELKGIAVKYGYNLVLHGSLNRDLDLIAIPWVQELGDVEEMINEFAELLGGSVMIQTDEDKYCFPHGRMSYVINLNRGELLRQKMYNEPEFTNFYDNGYKDPQYYIDISVIPTFL